MPALLVAGGGVGAVEVSAFTVLEAGDGAVRRQQHAGGQRVGFDPQPVRVSCGDIQHPLANADAAVRVGGERRIAQSLEALARQPPVVRISLVLEQPP